MNLKTEAKEIDGITFETQQLPAMKGFALLTRLVKVVGPALAALAQSDENAQLESLGPIMTSALAGLNPNEASSLAIEILSQTIAKVPDATGGRIITLNSSAQMDLVFSGRLMTMFKVIGHAIQVNFRDFSAGSDPAAPPPPEPSAS